MIRPILFGDSEPFHLVTRNQPFARIQIYLRPFHVSKVSRSAKQQRGQLQRTTDRHRSAVAIQCFKQCAELFRIGHGSKVLHPFGWERTREIPDLVGWGDTGSFGELENLFVDLGDTTRPSREHRA